MKKNDVGNIPGVDGVDHINFYSRGATELGRLGSHFARLQFTHPTYGTFESMEGFWYFIKREEENDEEAERLRYLHGYAAKEHGKTIKSRHLENFQRIVISGNWHKFNQNPRLKALMVESTLPIDHYYVVGGGKVMVRPNGFDWLVEGFENIRKHLKLQHKVLSEG